MCAAYDKPDVKNREVIVQAGDTIARRFGLVRADDVDLPGLDRYLATDTRLGMDVTVDIITSGAPSAVIRTAQRARMLRDKRLSRVLAAGIERRGNDRIFYVASERPHGVRLDELVGKIAFTPASAAAVVGEAAAALSAVVGTGMHHGLMTAEAITVTDRGRVIVTGLGIDGAIAAQSGRVKVTNERADAVALAKIFLAAITAMDPADVTTKDIPDDVPTRARDLCHAVLKGSGPTSLADVTAALGTGDSHILKTLVSEAPSLWWPRAPLVLIATAGDGDLTAAPAHQASSSGDDDLDRGLDEAEFIDGEVVDGELVHGEMVTIDPDGGVIDGDVIDIVAARPRTRFGGAVDDLDEFHDIVAAQNVGPQHSVAEAVLERLHQRFPASSPLAKAAAAAHRRAYAPAPLNVGPLLVALLLVAVFVAAIVGTSLLTKPYVPDFDGYNNPPQTYPAYTIGVTPPPE